MCCGILIHSLFVFLFPIVFILSGIQFHCNPISLFHLEKQLLRHCFRSNLNNCWTIPQTRRANSKWCLPLSFFICLFYSLYNSNCNLGPSLHYLNTTKLNKSCCFSLLYLHLSSDNPVTATCESSPFTAHSICPPTQQHHVVLMSFVWERHFIKCYLSPTPHIFTRPWSRMCVGVLPWECADRKVLGKAFDCALWSDTQYNQCGQSMSDKPECIMKPIEEAELNQRQ